MQIGKFNLTAAVNEFWESPKRNMNLLMLLALFVIVLIYSFIFGMIGSVVMLLFADMEQPTGSILYTLFNLALNLIITLPIMIWQFAFIIENLKELFHKGSNKLSEIGHVLEVEKIKNSLKPALGYLAVFYLYLAPTILISIISSLMIASWQTQYLETFGSIYSADTNPGVMPNFSGLLPVLLLALLSLLYTLVFYIFVNPAILVIGIKHGFSVALSPIKIGGFIKRNLNDLIAYFGVNLVVAVIFFALAIASAILMIVCVGFLGFIALIFAASVFQLYITPALMAQAWGDNK